MGVRAGEGDRDLRSSLFRTGGFGGLVGSLVFDDITVFFPLFLEVLVC
jgi:hypothetical protein